MKDKKPLIIIVAVVLILGIAGYFFMNRTGGTMNPLASTNPGDMVANALTGSGSVRCEYTEEGQNIVSYIKNGAMRSDVTGGPEGSISMIYKDNTSWTWNNDTKEGMMFKAPEVTPIEGEEVQSETDTTVTTETEEMKAEIEKYKDACKNENIPDSMFEAPSDVTFQDYSAMMQQQMDRLPADYQQYMPQQ